MIIDGGVCWSVRGQDCRLIVRWAYPWCRPDVMGTGGWGRMAPTAQRQVCLTSVVTVVLFLHEQEAQRPC